MIYLQAFIYMQFQCVSFLFTSQTISLQMVKVKIYIFSSTPSLVFTYYFSRFLFMFFFRKVKYTGSLKSVTMDPKVNTGVKLFLPNPFKKRYRKYKPLGLMCTLKRPIRLFRFKISQFVPFLHIFDKFCRFLI